MQGREGGWKGGSQGNKAWTKQNWPVGLIYPVITILENEN